MGHGFGCGDRSCIGISGTLFVYCGCRHGLGYRLGLLGLFVFSFFVLSSFR